MLVGNALAVQRFLACCLMGKQNGKNTMSVQGRASARRHCHANGRLQRGGLSLPYEYEFDAYDPCLFLPVLWIDSTLSCRSVRWRGITPVYYRLEY